MSAITIQDLNNGKSDLDHIAAIALSAAGTATDRNGGVKRTLTAAVASIAALVNRGVWAAAETYAVKDLVSSGGAWYMCVSGHTAGASFGGDQAAKWRLYQGLLLADLKEHIGEGVSLRSFGLLANDGTSNDAALFQAAAASGAPVIDATGVNCFVGSAVNIPSNQIWLLKGATIRFASSSQTVFNCAGVTGFGLIGPFTIIGDGATEGTAKGIRISDCANWYVDRPVIKSVRGWGIYSEPGSSTTDRGQHGAINHPRIDGCYKGYQDIDGTGAEYCTILNPHITGCADVGLQTAAGNVLVHGGHIIDNMLDGVRVVRGGGVNSNHGGFFGVNINHNGRHNLHAQEVTNGETFQGCHFYGSDLVGQGSIFLDRSKGILIDGGVIDCWVYSYKGGSSGINYIRNMYCPGGYGFIRAPGANNGHDELIIEGCFGAGSHAISSVGNDPAGGTMNDAGPCYVHAERRETIQSLASGVTATLLWPIVVSDRRLAFNAATGAFTVGLEQAGVYRIALNAIFNGSGMDAANSYGSINVGASDRRLMLGVAFGTTKVSIAGSVDIVLSAADVVTVAATIAGTAPNFGDPTWHSSLSIQRLA